MSSPRLGFELVKHRFVVPLEPPVLDIAHDPDDFERLAAISDPLTDRVFIHEMPADHRFADDGDAP
jgi:hypothetical protein